MTSCPSRAPRTIDPRFHVLRRLARAIVRRPHDADDLAQDVAVAMLRREADLPATIEIPEAYLRVALRRAAARARARADRSEPIEASEEIVDDTPTPEETTSSRIDRERLVCRLRAALSPRDAHALALIVDHGLDADEAAIALATTRNGVHQMRHRIVTAARRLQAESGT